MNPAESFNETGEILHPAPFLESVFFLYHVWLHFYHPVLNYLKNLNSSFSSCSYYLMPWWYLKRYLWFSGYLNQNTSDPVKTQSELNFSVPTVFFHEKRTSENFFSKVLTKIFILTLLLLPLYCPRVFWLIWGRFWSFYPSKFLPHLQILCLPRRW